VTALLNGAPVDDDAGVSMTRALVSSCPGTVTPFAASQFDAGVLDAVTGEPLTTGQLLCAAGGSFFHRSIQWMERNNLAHVRDTSPSLMHYELQLRDGGVVATGPASSLSPTHDILVIQLQRTPSGSVVANAGGFFAEGTVAAAWYFNNVIVPMRVGMSTPFFVLDWTDMGPPGPDATDLFVVLNP
jgi:hypothetical protein